MSTTTKQVRKFALAISLITSVTLVLASCSTSNYGVDANPATSKYVIEQFDKNDGQFLAPFSAGQAEPGLTLESMIHLGALGYDKAEQKKAVDWATSNTALLTSPGLKATYIFAAHALGFADDATVSQVLTELKASISDDGSVEATNNFSYGWVIFALLASDEDALANSVAVKLTTFSETGGAFKYTQNDAASSETADVTSIALLALKATEGLGTGEDEAAKAFAISKVTTWLTENLVDGSHYESFGSLDVSGTAYAIMALQSLGQDIEKQQEWLTGRINAKDGGVLSPWTEPESDTFSSAQSLLPLSKLSFLDVLKNLAN